MPERPLSPMVGDLFQNLRNSLDHLARALVETSGGTPVMREFVGPTCNQLPITHTARNPVISGLDRGFAGCGRVS